MNTNMVHLTRIEYLRFRRACRIDTPGPKRGFCIQYDIPGHDAPFKLYNYGHQLYLGKSEPYSILYAADDVITDLVVRSVRAKS